MARPLPIRPSRPNLGTKSPKASPPWRSLPWIRAALPLARRSRRSRLRPVTPPAPKKRRSFISTCLTCIRSKIIPLASGTMRKCRGLWSRSRQQGVDQPALVRPHEDNGYYAHICYLIESFHAFGRNCALHKNREKRKVRIIPDLQNHLWKTASVCFASVNSKLSAQHERRNASINALL